MNIQMQTLDFASARAAIFKMTALRLSAAVVVVALSIVSFGANSASAIDKSTWILPFAPDKHGLIHLLNPYRQPNSDYSAGHRGVDYRVAIGQQIFAPADGTIAFAGQVANRKLLTIRHSGELVSELEPACALSPVGTVVRIGQPIATICNDLPGYVWHCPDTCVHFSLRSNGKYLSPLALIGGLSPSRLLPLGRIN
jgi:murein DD-endopeptidase MepM/ murein hydrolase activator NlpD